MCLSSIMYVFMERQIENTKMLLGLIQQGISLPFCKLILQLMLFLSLFPLLGIPDKENVSSYSVSA